MKPKQHKIKSLFSILLAVFVFTPLAVKALPSLDQQIKDIENRIKENKGAVNQKKGEANDLQSQVKVMDQGIASTQTSIESLNKDISDRQKEIDKLVSDIKINETRMLNNKEDLKKMVQLLYEKGDLTAVEILASTSSVTNFLNQEEYNRAIQEKINTTITEIKTLKAQLEQQKKDQEGKKVALQSQRDKLEKERQNQLYQKSIKDNLLAQTKGEQAGYEKMLKQSEAIAADLYEERASQGRSSNEWYGGGGSGYPGRDYWGFIPYQCTSYAAWKWNAVYGKYWINTQPGRGSAMYWPEIARTLISRGYPYSVSGTPRVGAIMVWGYSRTTPYGHVAIVEAVHGGTVDVSEYNWIRPGAYGYRGNVSTSGRQFIY